MDSLNSIRRSFRSFKSEDTFKSGYFLLPFTFKKFLNFELIVNSVGDSLIAPVGTVEMLIEERFSEVQNLNELLVNMVVGAQNDLAVVQTLANRLRHKRDFNPPSPVMHIVVLTLRCDHTCKYCQVSRVSQDKEKFDLSRSNTILVADAILSSTELNITIEFQGGESLLAFESLKEFVEMIKDDNRSSNFNITWVICTSLSILKEEHVLYFKENNINISSSLDGPSDIHDGIRKIKTRDSYNRVISGLELIEKNWTKDRVSALMTTTLKSFDRAKDIIDEYLSHGFNEIFLRPISPYGFARKNKDSQYEITKFLEFYKSGLEYMLELNKKGINVKEYYTVVLLRGLLTPEKENYVDLMSPIGGGRISIVYDYDGYVYISDEARMLAQNRDFTFQLGHITEGMDVLLSSRRNKMIQSVGLNDLHLACSDCVYRNACGSDPLFHHASQHGDAYGNMAISEFCRRNMETLDYLVEMSVSRPKDFAILKAWL